MSSNSTIAKQVVSELESMHDQLITFKSNVVYLNDAKSNINTAAKALKTSEDGLKSKIGEFSKILETVNVLKDSSFELVGKIDSIDFPERLQHIEETVIKSVKEIEASRKVTIRELESLVGQISDVDFNGNFKNLKNVVDASAKSNSKIVEVIQKQDLPKRIEIFQGNVEGVLKASVDLLNQSSKKTASDTLKTVQDLNLPIRVDKLDANIAGIQASVMNVINKTDNLERDIREQFNKLNQQLDQHNKAVQARQLLILGLVLLTAIGCAVGFYLLSNLK